MTRRVQFQRSSVSGSIPTRVTAGTPAFNWPDQKMYVGGAGDTVDFVIQRIDDWVGTNVYRARDFVVYEGDLYRALTDIPADVGFRNSEWRQMTNIQSDITFAKADNGIFEGGQVSMIDTRNISVAAGSGIIVNRQNPDIVVVTFVEWGDFTRVFDYSGNYSTFCAYMTEAGTVDFRATLSFQEISTKIPLAGGHWNVGSGEMVQLWDSRIYTSHTMSFVQQETLGSFPKILNGGLLAPTTTGGPLGISVSPFYALMRDINIGGVDENRIVINGSDSVEFTILSTAEVLATDAVSITPAVYDNGGVVTAVPAGNATAQTLYWKRGRIYAVSLGQRVWPNLQAALVGWDSYKRSLFADGGPLSLRGNADGIELGTIFVTAECTDLSNAATCRIMTARYGDMYLPQSDTDLSAYYKLDGTTSLLADFNMGGFAAAGGDLDGEKSLIRPITTETTGDTPSGAEDRELSVNKADRKVFSQDTTVADRTEQFSATRAYKDGDTCFEGSVLYLNSSGSDIPAGAFDPLDWEAIGSSADISSAVILKPLSSSRNVIDLEGSPNITGLTISPDFSSGQIANVASFGGAIIDRYGMGRGTLGSVVIRVSQATHGFTAVGQAVAYSQPNWVRANASNLTVAGKALGVIHRIVDANNFDLQLGGVISGVQSTAFVGGSVVSGSPYYVSSTNGGLLTATPPATPNRVDPVLVMTTKTEGVIALTSVASAAASAVGGNTTFSVSQTAHGFTVNAIGRPVYKDDVGGLWKFARADSLGTVGIALIESITNANNFVVNIAGYIGNLNVNSFVGNVAPSAGVFYYVSQTAAGKLTEVVPTQDQNRNLLFFALSSTTGVVMPYEPEAPTVGSRGAQSMEGPLFIEKDLTTDRLIINDNVPIAIFKELDFQGGKGWRGMSSGGVFYIQTTDASNNSSGEASYRFNRTANLGASTDVVTRANGDLRYGQLGSSNTWSSAQSISDGLSMNLGSVSKPALRITGDADTGIYSPASAQLAISLNGTQRYLFNNGTSTNSVLTTGIADGRYLKLSGGTLTSTLNGTLFRGSSGTSVAPTFAFTGDSNTGLYNISANKIGVSLAGNLRYTFDNGTGTTSVLTTAKGDARYGGARATVIFDAIARNTASPAKPHGLGSVPNQMTAFLVCNVAEHGYSIGDRISLPVSYGVGNSGAPANMVVTCDASTVRVTYGVYNQLPSKLTGARAVLTDSRWGVRVIVST